MADCTLILAWRYHLEHIKLTSFNKQTRICNIFCCKFDSPEEAGRYLETYKSYEKKPADALKEQVEKDYLSKVRRLRQFDWTGCIASFTIS